MKRKFELSEKEVKELIDLLEYLNACCGKGIVSSIKNNDNYMAQLYASVSNRTDYMLKLIRQWKEM